MNTLLQLCKKIFLSLNSLIDRNTLVKETDNNADVEGIQQLLQQTTITNPVPHESIGVGIQSLLGTGPFVKKVNTDGTIIIAAPAEELHIKKHELIYMRKHRRMDGSNKMFIVVHRNPLTFNPKSSNIAPGFMRTFMESYLHTVTKHAHQLNFA